MTVYGDLYFIINALCDLLLLQLISLLTKRRARRARLFAGALIGGAYALLTLYIPRLPALLLSFPASVFMILAAFSFVSLRRFLLHTAIFYGAGFLLSGAVNFFSAFLEERLPMPLSALLLLFILIFACALSMLFCETVRRRATLDCADLRFTSSGRSYACSALIDSGNLLTDALTGKPVILFSPLLFDAPPPPGRTVPVETVTGRDELPLIELSGLSVNGHPVSALGAVCRTCEDFAQHEALLPSSLITTSSRKKGSLRLRLSKN